MYAICSFFKLVISLLVHLVLYMHTFFLVVAIYAYRLGEIPVDASFCISLSWLAFCVLFMRVLKYSIIEILMQPDRKMIQ